MDEDSTLAASVLPSHVTANASTQLPPFATTAWIFAGFLAILLMVDARKRCYECSCTGLELLYLPAYALAITADWLQGPYVYALYSALGFDRTDINMLFVIGFGTSMLAGPFIGQLADRFGRKQMILTMYCGMYTLACVTKHFDLYWALLIGRLCGGVATSVLFSCFESWLVAEHNRLGLAHAALKQVLTYQYFINGLAGCLIGILAQLVVDSMPITSLGAVLLTPTADAQDGAYDAALAAAGSTAPWWAMLVYVGGETLPFDMSAACLLLAALVICFTWKEQIWYAAHEHDQLGASTTASATAVASSGTASPSILQALRRVMADARLVTVMIVASCTESAMYAFVIEWTPALSPPGVDPPHGLIFSSFMIMYMSGSTLFGMLSPCCSPQALLIVCTALSLLAMAAVFALFHLGLASTANGSYLVFLLFCSFELSLGGYMAAIATLKAQYVPDDIRATVYNLFRVPLNLIVVVLNVVSLSSEFTFLACTCLMAAALAGSVAICLMATPAETIAKDAEML